MLEHITHNFTMDNISDHVWVVPVSWSSEGLEDILVVCIVADDPYHTVPAVTNVIVVPPQVADVSK